MISIIIPTYNSAETIEKCLASISKADATVQIVVSDDGSTDNTSILAKKWEITLLTNKLNKGSGHARNKGIDAATGDILIFVDSDIEIMDDTLKNITTYFCKNPEVDALTGMLSKKHPNENFYSQYKNLYMNYVFAHQPVNVSFLYGSICAIKRKSIRRWPEDMNRGVDTKMGMELTANGKTIHLVHSIEVIHHKKYNLLSLIKNDFAVPFAWSKLFIHYLTKTKTRHNAFAHSSLAQIFALLLSFAILISLFSHQHTIFVIISLLWFLINLRFLLYLFANLNLSQSLFCILFTFFDQFIMFLGIFCGLPYSVFHKVTHAKQRTYDR